MTSGTPTPTARPQPPAKTPWETDCADPMAMEWAAYAVEVAGWDRRRIEALEAEVERLRVSVEEDPSPRLSKVADALSSPDALGSAIDALDAASGDEYLAGALVGGVLYEARRLTGREVWYVETDQEGAAGERR